MIVLKDLTKVFRLNGRRKVVADNINAVFPTGVAVGLLGRNGAGKSTLLKMIAGTTHPTSGDILSTGSVSFPVGLASSLHPDMTGAQNTRFVARIYGADTEALMDYVREFADLGEHFHLPVRSYSSGMRGRLSFGINMGLDFETYLIDEVTATGDAAFKRKSRDVFLSRTRNAGAVFVSHSMGAVREMCTAGAYLENGRLRYFDDVEEAIDLYMSTLDQDSVSVQVPDDLPPAAEKFAFPYDARMLFGIGLPQTRIDWLGDCLRRHRPCHFAKAREPHYFDGRAGLADDMVERRRKTIETLSARLKDGDDAARRNTLRLLGEASAVMTIHAAPATGKDRHAAYLDYLLANRQSQPVVCDVTPGYALLGEADFAEMSAIGRAAFTCVLRDPAARLWAQIWEDLPPRRRGPDACAAAARQLMAEPGRLDRYPQADYARLIRALEAAVPPERIVWLFHETLTDRPALRPLCDFLDIPNVPEISLPPLPAPAEPEMPEDVRHGFHRLLADQYAAAQRRFGAALPEDWAAPAPPVQAVAE